ncbi:MAG: hypothetical protein JXA57_03050 [Armatimonadetes bacterium]|nr:hypothetical protein [Armatimonadota bacterium]
MLSRVAFREGPIEEGAVVFYGNHVTHTYILPIQGPHEDNETFAERRRKFRIPRKWTLSLVVAVAHEALTRQGHTDESAAAELLEELDMLASGWKKPRFCGERKINWRTFENPFGTSARSHRSRPKRADMTDADRRRTSLRCEVARVKSKHEDFGRLFEQCRNEYRSQFPDQDWFDESEAVYRARIDRLRSNPGNLGVFDMCQIGGLGQLYLEVGRVSEALSLFKEALRLWKTDGQMWPHQQADAIRALEERIQMLTA